MCARCGRSDKGGNSLCTAGMLSGGGRQSMHSNMCELYVLSVAALAGTCRSTVKVTKHWLASSCRHL